MKGATCFIKTFLLQSAPYIKGINPSNIDFTPRLSQYSANMRKYAILFFLEAILTIGLLLRSSPSAEAVPLQFPERHVRPVTLAPSVDAQGHMKCPRGYRLVHSNCRKAYG